MSRGGKWIPFAAVAISGGMAIAFFASGAASPASTQPTPTVATTPATTAAPSTTQPAPPTTVEATPDSTTTTTALGVSRDDVYGGVAEVGVIGSADTLNPFIERSGLGNAVGSVTWASAFVIDGGSYDLRPGVLKEIPSFENGGLVTNEDRTVQVILRLDPEARWQDGQAITGDDLLFTAELLSNDRRIDRGVRDLYAIVSSPFATTDAFTFTVTEPTIDYLRLFDVILPRHQMEGTDLFSDWGDRVWLSAGPFIAGTIQADGSVALRRNHEYRGVDGQGRNLPYLDGLVVRPYSNTIEVFTALHEKVLSVGDLAADYGLADGRDDLLVSSAEGEEWEHVGFQFGAGRFAANPRSIVSSPAFRDLVAIVVGDDELVFEIGGSSLYPASSTVGSSWPRAAAPDRPPLEEPTLDSIASELDRDFDEQPPQVVYATTSALDRSQMAGIALRELAARGVAVELQLQDPGLFFRDSVIEGSFEVAEWAWTVTPGPLGAVRDVQSWFGTSPNRDGLDFYRWSANTESDTLLAEIAALDSYMDLDQLQAALQSIDGQLLDLVVVVPLWQTSAGSSFDPQRIDGYVHPRFGVPITWNAQEWLVPGGCGSVPDGQVCGGRPTQTQLADPSQPGESG